MNIIEKALIKPLEKHLPVPEVVSEYVVAVHWEES